MARSKRYPTYTRKSTAVDVSRASQVHHTPHVGFPQIEPDAMVTPVNRTPISAADAASRSHPVRRVARYATLAVRTKANAR